MAEHLQQQLRRQALAMASYALCRGTSVPAKTLAVLDADPSDNDGFKRLAAAHETLAKLVAPARPATIEALGGGQSPKIVQRLSKVLVGSIAAVLVLGTAHAALGFGTGYGTESDSITSVPHFAVANALFVALATLGASFQGLMTTQRRINAMTFELRDRPAVWARLWLGVVAGLLMATYLDVGATGSATMDLGRPLLALLGGFGSDVVYRALDGLVKGLSAALERNVDDRLQAERTRSALALERATDEERRSAAQNLLSIKKALIGGSIDDARALVDAMLPTSEPAPAPAPEPAAVPEPAEAAQ